MFRITAGETLSRAYTVAGSGALSTETFASVVRDPAGRIMTSAAAVTDAAARQITVTVAADQWTRGEGGVGQLEVLMTASGSVTAVAEERFRVMPGVSITPGGNDDYWE